MARTITIVDYHAGNLTSVQLAVEKLGYTAQVTSDPAQVRNARRLIFPGQGAAQQSMDALGSLQLEDALRDYVGSGRPMLGICIGAQIILDHSDEGDVECLGLIPGRVERLQVPAGVKVPHMGWNAVRIARPHPVWRDVPDESQFYFVHSFAPAPARPEAALGTTDYHGRFVSALAQDNVVACQFHPERSGRIGLKLLQNFLSWDPEDAQ